MKCAACGFGLKQAAPHMCAERHATHPECAERFHQARRCGLCRRPFTTGAGLSSVAAITINGDGPDALYDLAVSGETADVEFEDFCPSKATMDALTAALVARAVRDLDIYAARLPAAEVDLWAAIGGADLRTLTAPPQPAGPAGPVMDALIAAAASSAGPACVVVDFVCDTDAPRPQQQAAAADVAARLLAAAVAPRRIELLLDGGDDATFFDAVLEAAADTGWSVITEAHDPRDDVLILIRT